jgi:hypothetical protein
MPAPAPERSAAIPVIRQQNRAQRQTAAQHHRRCAKQFLSPRQRMRTFKDNDQRQGRQQNISAKEIPARHDRFSGGCGRRRAGRGGLMSAHQGADARTDRRCFWSGDCDLPRPLRTAVQEHLQISTQNLLCHDAKRGQKSARRQILFLGRAKIRGGTGVRRKQIEKWTESVLIQLANQA